jgi:hypothetical protein
MKRDVIENSEECPGEESLEDEPKNKMKSIYFVNQTKFE